MRCTVLLVTLMVCTVSFIYGTQSDSVLKEVLSAAGNDPRLHETRDGNKKYGPFRKALISESMKHTKRHDGLLSSSKLPVQQCEDIQRVCNKMERISGSQHPSLTEFCKCDNLAQTECNKNWDHSAHTLTWRTPQNRDFEIQLKFCLKMRHKMNCTSTQTAATFDQINNKWIYEANCGCPTNKVELDTLKLTDSGMWKWSFVCHKRACSGNENCVKRYTRRVSGMLLTNYTYFCVCPGNGKCLKPEADTDAASEVEKGEYSSTTYSRCVN